VAASDDFPLTEAERAFLRCLADAGVPFLVVGLGAAVLQGADASTQDLDLWFESLADPRIAEAAASSGGVFAWRANPPMIAGDGLDHLDIVVHCHGLKAFDAEYVKAIDLDLDGFSIKVLPLERVIASKKAAGRPKDKAALEALQAALAARRSTREK
jgi:predicted nucleotidyltransferase